MARIRTIKPDFFTSEDIVSLSCLARLLYIAIWCEADREGRLTWRPNTFKIRYLPADECDIQKLAQELIDAKLVVKYSTHLAYIPSFLKHQHINPRETASILPSPDASSTRQARVKHAHPTHREEGKGKEGVHDASLTLQTFAQFWEAYPNKKAKPSAEKAWVKAKINGEFPELMAALELQKNSPQWLKDYGEYIPHPATWINQKRWLDAGTATASGQFAGVL